MRNAEVASFSLSTALLAGASVLLLALAFYAEAAGYGILCSTRGDLAVLGAVYGAMAALIALAYTLRRRHGGQGLLLILLAGLHGFFLWRFPFVSYTSLVMVISLALPLALYPPWPWNILLSSLDVLASFVLRFLIFPPEAFMRRDAALMDMASYLFFGLLASAAVSLRAEPARRLEEARRALAEASRINLGYQDWGSASHARFRSEERKRLARDIHDTVGYALTNTIMTLEAARLMARREPEKMEEFIGQARDHAEGALAQVRRDLSALRESAEGDAKEAVERSVEVFRITSGMDISLDWGATESRLGGEKAKALRHFVQEAMLNAFRHGRAGRLALRFSSSGGLLTATATDDGRGARSVREGIGIKGMRERAGALGGGIEYRSLPSGFSISMRIPLDGETGEAAP